MRIIFALTLGFFAAVGATAHAQDKGTVNPKPLPPLANPDDPKIPAKELFGRRTLPADMSARSIGFYSRGCLAGGTALSIDGDAWQVMRLSRNRNWGHPDLIRTVERIARQAKSEGVWPGLLVGDISQPRGGPMLTGHASHQIGLDVDIWLTPMPTRTLNRLEREETSATDMVRADKRDINPRNWTPAHVQILRIAAQQPNVERILVNAAIKKAVCRDARGDRQWLSKIRPYWGHNYHFHVRVTCPPGGASCNAQGPPPRDEGCDSSLDWWFTDAVLNPKPNPNWKPKPPMTMAQLPAECRVVVKAK
ncbi:MAG: penicillin-insensitive murein endopeptidase [Beijerinckiaceae bacterium]|nr:penicillin-insensitive murein endopeptidase [Beijerinckiaceae bacterium]